MPKRTYRISGRVVDRKTRDGIGDLRVEAWDKDSFFDGLVGTCPTDRAGAFRIVFDESYLRELSLNVRPDLYFRVFRGDTLLLNTRSSVMRDVGLGDIDVALDVDVDRPLPQEPQGITHRLVGQVFDRDADVPLPGFLVRATDPSAEEGARDLGYDVTDPAGRFTVVFSESPNARPGRMRALLLTIYDRGSREVAQAELARDPDQKQPVPIPIRLPENLQRPSSSIDEVSRVLPVAIPKDLGSYLEARHIRTLDDVRRAGGLGRLAGLPVAAEHPAVRLLESHADLSRLSGNLLLNTQLIERGYTSVYTVARSTRADFVRTMRDELGDFGAARMQGVASAQSRFLLNAEAALRADLASGVLVGPAIGIPQFPLLFPPQCGCDDCQAAVSPLAYLADLLDYALAHISDITQLNNPRPITLTELGDTFLQPFRDLPTDCEAVERRVRQVRVCIEVMRRYLAAHPPALMRRGPLAVAERTYRELAYQTLLTRLGGSYDALRLARGAADDARRALAERLGIALGRAGLDYLDALLLDPRAAAGESTEITEGTLERLLGLVDTRRDPLSEGAKSGDPQSQIARWNFDGIRWNRNTDRDGNIYLRVRRVVADYVVEAFRDSNRAPAQRVAFGVLRTASGTLRLNEVNGSGLSGRVQLNYVADSNAIAVNAIPFLLSWRLERLRTVWREQDWAVDTYSSGILPPESRRPFIDPDVTGPDDFRTPFVKANAADPDRAFDIWLRRRQWVDARVRALSAIQLPNGTPDLVGMIAAVYQPADAAALAALLAELDTLQANLTRGADLEATAARISGLNLTAESFSRLMALRAKEREADADPRSPRPTHGEWREIVAILVQAQKTQQTAAWLAEEQAIDFGPGSFWPSLSEPSEGLWPPLEIVQGPHIDPEVLSMSEAMELRPGRATARLWQARSATLERIRAELQLTREANGFDAMARASLGDPLPRDFAALQNDLASGNQALIDAALNVITTQFFMSREMFERLLAIQARDVAAAGPPVTAAEWGEVYAVLTTSRKIRQEYANWLNEEAQLPRLDPETVPLNGLPEPPAGARARALWGARQAEWEQLREALRQAREAQGFDAMLRLALGEPNPRDPLPHDVTVVNADLTSVNAADRWRATVQIALDLYLTTESFSRLMALRARSDDPNVRRRPTAAEWNEAFAILTSARKEKFEYRRWLQEEHDAITGVPYWATFKARLPHWRASGPTRSEWRRALATRSQPPLIDPDLIGPGDLRDSTSGVAFGLWQARRTVIDATRDVFRNTLVGSPAHVRFDAVLSAALFGAEAGGLTRIRLRSVREAYGLDRALQEVFGVPLPDLDGLAADLANPANAVAARIEIAESLYLTRPAFERLMLIRGLDAAGQPVSAAHWAEVDTILTQASTARSALASAVARTNGEDITGRLEQLSLSTAAFVALLRVRGLAVREAPLLESEWEDVYSILAQAHKRRLFARWRGEEDAVNVIVGPDRFAIPTPPPLQFPPVSPAPLPAWRATERARRDWQDAVQARIDQEASVIAAFHEAVSDTEEAILPGLRDALIVATDPPANPPLAGLRAKARWVTGHLAIDAESDGCHQTTRISQAIETLQGILWSLRIGLLQQTYPTLRLDADRFYAEWVWMGSYATWRAAVFVFLYPENILLPSLRRRRTPAFTQLVNDLRSNRLVSPDQACDAARAYADYFRDVCSLTLEATCDTRTRMHRGDCRDRSEIDERDLSYLFASGGATNTVYWSVYDRVDVSGYAQTFWRAVPGLSNVLDVVGAMPYEQAPEQRFVFLFVRVEERGTQKLVFVKYDLIRQLWETTPTELELPNKATAFSAVVKQTYREDRPPHLAIRLANGAIYIRALNAEGNDWQDSGAQGNESGDDWTPVSGFMRGWQFRRLLAMVETSANEFYLFAESGTLIYYRVFGTRDDGYWSGVGRRFVGAFAWPGTPDVFVFSRANLPPAAPAGPPVESTIVQAIRPQTSPAGQPRVTRAHDFIAFHVWLIQVTGVSFTDITITDENAYFGLNYTEFFGLNQNTPEYLDARTHYVAWIDSGLMKEGSPRAKEWQLADEMVQTFSVNTLSLTQALTEVLAGNQVEFSLRYGGSQQSLRATGTEVSPFQRDLPDRVSIAPNSGGAVTAATGLFAYERMESGLRGVHRCLFTRAGNILTESETARIGPFSAGPYDITERCTAEELQVRSQQVAAAFVPNLGPPASNLAYLEEAYFLVPVHLALQLQGRGHYDAALDWFRTVYDYSAPAADRKIYDGLRREETLSTGYTRAQDWLLDPLDPHAIAGTRANTYTRFTLVSLVRCFLEYADAEFTRDTAESIPRARTLYLTALDLLETDVLRQRLNGCDELIGELDITVGGEEWIPLIAQIRESLAELGDAKTVRAVRDEVVAVLAEVRPMAERVARAQAIVATARARMPTPATYGRLFEVKADSQSRISRALLADRAVAQGEAAAGAAAAADYLHSVSVVSGIPASTLEAENTNLPWLREPFVPGGLEGRAPLARFYVITGLPGLTIPAPTYHFCIPQNPVLQALRLKADLNLYKLRTCRNIAGVERELDPYAAPTDTTSGLPQIGPGGQLSLPGAFTLRPTPYRYRVLIERARQLVQFATQVEAGVLTALEKRDAEYYGLLKARQDVHLTQSGVRLQLLRVREAQDGVRLAELQQERAQLQVDHYQELLDEGLSALEQEAIGFLVLSGTLQIASAVLSFVASGFSFTAAGVAAATSLGTSAEAYAHTASGLSAIGSGLSSLAGASSTTASILSTYASYERRSEEWEFQRTIARQDVRVGVQQVTNAEDHVRVIGQERVIAELQADHARDTLDFLSHKFTNVELYDWMSDVLGGVYSFFLQQATAMAKLAENQLAFERQQVPPAFIQADYWDAPGDFAGGIAESTHPPDRRGLTGSARLLQDIQRVDQYAFETDQRKLQLTKTFSLARLAPNEFQRLKETGVMTFATPMVFFDRDFPGHYLRLVKRVRVSVIALIPPVQGIRATLSTTGISRVVVGGDLFQTQIVRRDPESIALSSPRDATGLFELEPQGEMLLPFEGLGVDARWELRMPKPANLFDYRTLADVLLTVDYTALDSFDYREQVIQTLDRPVSADRPFSFRNELADPWYELHNPDQSGTPMTVRFTTRRDDFPPNLEDIRIQHLVLYFARKAGAAFELDDVRLLFTEQGTRASIGGDASTLNGLISTRTGTAASWSALLGKPPIGEWQLALPDEPETYRLFRDEHIEEILFDITYTGRPSEYP